MSSWQQAGSGDLPGSACLQASFRSGNNALGGPWEYSLGAVGGSTFTGQFAWGGSGTQLESGNVSVDLKVPPNGGSSNLSSWSVDGATTLSFGGKSYNSIQKIGIQVQIDGNVSPETCEWTSLAITFYDSNNTPSSVDTSTHLPNMSGSGISGSDFWIAIPDSGFTAVRAEVSGQIHLNAGSNKPGTAALVGNIYIWTDSCA
jgi:hypothetical protein